MSIREATPDDASEVRRVAVASWHAAHDDVIGADAVERLLDRWYDPEDLPKSIERPEAPMFVAEEDGDVVGFAQGGPSEEGPADAVVGRIYVHPDDWGQGYGSQLLDRLFDAFRAEGYESVSLAVMADNEVGRSFYDEWGFSIHAERTVELAGETVDDVILVRDL